MSGQPFPVQNSTLAAEALASVLRQHYPLPGEVKCRFFRKGICDTYRAYAGDHLYFLKVYRHGRRNQADVSEEVRLLNHLAADGISVARPIARSDGQWVCELVAPEGVRYAVLFESAQGELDDDGVQDRIRAFGHAVARMHASLDGFPFPYRRRALDLDHLVGENMRAISSFMEHRPADLAVIGKIAEECGKLAVLRTKEGPEFGVCHGDLHGGDVSYDRFSKPTLFDFDSSGCGWRALDIGVFLASYDWMNTSAEAEGKRQERLHVFLDGYSRVRELGPNEMAAVENTPPIRHIFLMGHVLRYTTVHEGDHWANDRFIDWHMKWFNSWAEKGR